MVALLLVVALTAGWSLIGLGLLALVRAQTSELRVVLTAPAIGTAVTALVAFVFSEAGTAVQDCAVWIAIVLVFGSSVIVALRRPRVHPCVFAVAIVAVAGLLLTGWPAFSLGFRWLGNGNDDMSNYVLSAQDLLKHGVLASIDFRDLAQGRDYATVFAGPHLAGARPGSEMLLAFVSAVTGRSPYEAFMPLILAFNLCVASSVGALAMQVARRWWAAPLAACLVLVSPLASYAVVQQLVAQVWGLGVAVGLLALLMRPELHSGAGPGIREVVPIGTLASALVLGYVELLPQISLAYVAYVAILGARRRLGIAALARLWLPAIGIAVVVLNGYFFTELSFLHFQSTHGLSAGPYPPLFGYILVPSGLPGIVGLQTLPPGQAAPYLNVTIAFAAVLIVGAAVASLASAGRGGAAAIVLVVDGALAILLALRSSDFGLFKLSMYVQPFLAAAVAIWLSGVHRRRVLGVAAVALAALLAASLSSQRAYVKESQHPTDAPNLSATDVLPAFHAVAMKDLGPVVSVTENPVLIKLEAASAAGQSVLFQSRDVFYPFVREYAGDVSGARHARVEEALRSWPWVPRSFDLIAAEGAQDSFGQDTCATSALASGRCELIVPSAKQVPFNRYSLPDASPDLVAMPCDAPHNVLAFTSSNLGQSFYLPTARKHVSFYQLQRDPFFPGRTMAGFGRYALFQVLGSSSGERLVIELTDTFTHDGANLLPPAAAVGSSRVPLPVEGRGSARVFSAPLRPQAIAGTPYLLLDMGVDGRLPTVERPGLQDLYGRSVPTDPRYLTAYVRDISVVSATRYAHLRTPSALRSFPADLGNPNLEYSGLYEDGWMGSDGYVRLAGGVAAELVVQGQVPAGAGGQLRLLVNGHDLASVAATPGPLNMRAGVPASAATRRVELRFAKTIKLRAPDLRPVAFHLSFLGLVPHGAP
jgi:hypothetical protein